MSESDQPLSSRTPRPQPGGRRASLRAVDRAVGDLRRGDPVLVRPDSGPALLILAAETAGEAGLARMRELTGPALEVILTGQRAVALGLSDDPAGVIVLTAGQELTAEALNVLADPLSPPPAQVVEFGAQRRLPVDSHDGAVASTRLAKLARLLPALVAAPVERPLAAERLSQTTDILSVASFDIDHYEAFAAMGLKQVASARVPLEGAEETEVIAFRPADGGQEHLAIVIGDPGVEAALVRLHSACLTGDILGSLRCDCGPQLRGAVAEIARAGGGIILYLAQEGRGIGLVNKLRAYQLQDGDFDTVDANEMLGYDADERLYWPAAAMLRQLGRTRIRLMTNNPDKMADLARHGIDVVARVPHIFPANGHNEVYLATKKARSGHML